MIETLKSPWAGEYTLRTLARLVALDVSREPPVALLDELLRFVEHLTPDTRHAMLHPDCRFIGWSSALWRSPQICRSPKGKNMMVGMPDILNASILIVDDQESGFMYLMAILDVASRKVLAWRLSNTLTTHFCVEALEEAMRKYGRPEIFNTDQGSQFTSDDWITPLKAAGVAISMDGKGRWIDNVFIERLWRSAKYEEVYLRAYANGTEARASLRIYFRFYNERRLQENLNYATPDEVYFGQLAASTQAAA
jgi:putative transposase